MKIEYFESLFEKYDDNEFLKFKKVKNKLSKRRDLHAFLLLDKLVPSDDSIVSDSLHDEFFIGIDVEKLLKVITEEQVLELIRCGVRYDDDSLCMFA